MELRRALALTAIGVTSAVASFAAVAVADPLSLWTPDGRDLAESVQRAEHRDAFVRPCERTPVGTWRCFIEDDPGSGAAGVYLVELGADGCWHGTRYGVFSDATSATGGRRPLAACLQALDFLWPP